MARKTMCGKASLSPDDGETVSGLAEKRIIAKAAVMDLKKRPAEANKEIYG